MSEKKSVGSVKMCELMQQVKYISIEDIKVVLSDKTVITHWAYVLHDMDFMEDGVTPKEPHYHVFMKFKDSVQISSVAKWFGIKDNYISKIKGRWKSALKYLIHKNASDKYQYPVESVISNFAWEKEAKLDEIDINGIISLIDEGVIKEYNMYDHVDINTYTIYKSKIENALNYWRGRYMVESSRNISVTFIEGFTGSGKTTFAKQYCRDRNKTFCVSSSGNDAVQDYRGEDVLILDDLRDSVFSFTDILKLLDNHTKSTTKSRYNNKLFYGQEIIITSHEPLSSWYLGVDKEARIQLFRRIKTKMLLKDSKVYAYTYDIDEMDYIYYGSMDYELQFEEEKREKNMLESLGFKCSEEAPIIVNDFVESEDFGWVTVTQEEIF